MFTKIISVILTIGALFACEVAPFVQSLNAQNFDFSSITIIYSLPDEPYTILYDDSNKTVVEVDGEYYLMEK